MEHGALRTGIVLVAAAVLLTACDSGSGGAAEPPLETDPAALEAALRCDEGYASAEHPPVLLVHGTFTNGFEQFDWTWGPFLRERGFGVCTVTYPDRGFGDMQVSAEYVVHALRRMHAEGGRRVAVIGHSQGAIVPRWAVRWWPSARAAVSDLVLLAGPNSGSDATTLSDLVGVLLFGNMPAVFYQFAADSAFMQALNRGGQAVGDIDYTAIYTRFDELIQPVEPVPTAAIDFGIGNPRVRNILLQDICPGLLVDHLTIGLTDALTFALALDAISHDGPADVERAGGSGLCNALPLLPGIELVSPAEGLAALIGILSQEPGELPLLLHLTDAEPELKPYAQ